MRPRDIFWIFLKLGVTSFGGPAAHIGYFRHAFVSQRAWLVDAQFQSMVAIANLMPGPTSSQLGLMIGLHRAGAAGAAMAWLGFTLPSALIMILAGLGLASFDSDLSGIIAGLKWLAVAVVAHAILGMVQSMAVTWRLRGIVIVGALIAMGLPNTLGQWLVILGCGVLGHVALKGDKPAQTEPPASGRSRAGLSLLILLALLAVSQWLAAIYSGSNAGLLASLFQGGALVFGGGHLVLPMLDSRVVSLGYLDADVFVAGYSLAQAIPGPLFTLASYIGTAYGGWMMGLAATVAIFAPSFLLVAAGQSIRGFFARQPRLHCALAGINAGVIGLLLAAWLGPIQGQAMGVLWHWLVVAGLLLVIQRAVLPIWATVLVAAGLGYWLA